MEANLKPAKLVLSHYLCNIPGEHHSPFSDNKWWDDPYLVKNRLDLTSYLFLIRFGYWTFIFYLSCCFSFVVPLLTNIWQKMPWVKVAYYRSSKLQKFMLMHKLDDEQLLHWSQTCPSQSHKTIYFASWF